MFKDNKYTKWYEAIISKAREQVNCRTEGRFENHHIVPKSLGGSNDPSNLVRLTPREHFICHLLLMKMLDGSNLFKMVAAFNLMVRNTNQLLGRTMVTNRSYDASRFYKKVVFSEEHKRKISEAAKRRDPATRKQSAEANAKRSAWMKANPKTEEHIKKVADSQRGQIRGSWGSHTEETKVLISRLHAGKPKSEEHRKQISLAQTGKKRGPMGDAQRKKISEANRGKTRVLQLSPEERARRSAAMKVIRARQKKST